MSGWTVDVLPKDPGPDCSLPTSTHHTVAMGQTPTLITIPISHYCEKARWALERADVTYRERAHLQVLHWIPVNRAGGRKTAPVLVWGDRVFADSAEIVAEASAKAAPDRRLFP